MPGREVAQGVIFTLYGAFWLSQGIRGNGWDLLLVIGGAGVLLGGVILLVSAYRKRRPSEDQE